MLITCDCVHGGPIRIFLLISAGTQILCNSGHGMHNVCILSLRSLLWSEWACCRSALGSGVWQASAIDAYREPVCPPLGTPTLGDRTGLLPCLIFCLLLPAHYHNSGLRWQTPQLRGRTEFFHGLWLEAQVAAPAMHPCLLGEPENPRESPGICKPPVRAQPSGIGSSAGWWVAIIPCLHHLFSPSMCSPKVLNHSFFPPTHTLFDSPSGSGTDR
jgi:hypothetical protein